VVTRYLVAVSHPQAIVSDSELTIMDNSGRQYSEEQFLDNVTIHPADNQYSSDVVGGLGPRGRESDAQPLCSICPVRRDGLNS